MRRIPAVVLFQIMFVVAIPCAQSAAPAMAKEGKEAKDQTFPTRPVRAAVASPASSSPDLIARAITREAQVPLQ